MPKEFEFNLYISRKHRFPDFDNCEIRRKVISFHIYKYKDGYALKQSYWFYMTSNYNETLKPQIEESIDKVEWFRLKEIQSEILKDTYFTIADVVKEALVL